MFKKLLPYFLVEKKRKNRETVFKNDIKKM